MIQDFQFGFDFKRTNNDFAFGGFSISSSLTDIAEFPVLYTVTETDRHGTTSLANLVEVRSRSRFDNSNTDEAFQPDFSHFGANYASARYAYGSITLTRIATISAGTSPGSTASRRSLPLRISCPAKRSMMAGSTRCAAMMSARLRARSARSPHTNSRIARLQSFAAIEQCALRLGWGRQPCGGRRAPVRRLLGLRICARQRRVAPAAPNGTTLMRCRLRRPLYARPLHRFPRREWLATAPRAPGETRHESRLIFSAVVGDWEIGPGKWTFSRGQGPRATAGPLLRRINSSRALPAMSENAKVATEGDHEWQAMQP